MVNKTNSDSSSTRKIYRVNQGRVLGGVAGGIGQYFNLDPVLIRILFIVLAMGGGGIIFYFILWLVIPKQEDVEINSQQVTRNNVDEIKQTGTKYVQMAKNQTNNKNKRIYLAIILVVLGAYLCLANYGFLTRPSYYFRPWPLILVVFGLILFLNSNNHD